MSTTETGTLDGIDINAFRDGELDAVAGGSGLSIQPEAVEFTSGGARPNNLGAWDDLCKQLFGRTF